MAVPLDESKNPSYETPGSAGTRKGKPTKNYLAFDIEIARVLPENVADLMAYRPLGIACAATLKDDNELILWHGQTASGEITSQMTREEAQRLVRYLQEAAANGYTIYTWNGLGFDFDILGEESGLIDECRVLALGHVDMMFHFFCLKGYAIGLDKAAKGMGLPGKPQGMDGAMIPKMWAKAQHQKVLDYVTQDVRMVMAIARAVDSRRRICWINNRGNKNEASISGWLTPRDALKLPLPDTSWMHNPWPRGKFAGWTGLCEK